MLEKTNQKVKINENSRTNSESHFWLNYSKLKKYDYSQTPSILTPLLEILLIVNLKLDKQDFFPLKISWL